MAIDKLQKAREAAQKAAEELAKLEDQEAEKAAQIAAERAEKQRALDEEFLKQWEALDTQLMEAASQSASVAVYEGADPVQVIATHWTARGKRNVIRQHARDAYFRVHGEHPSAIFAMELSHRDMMIADRLEDAVSGAANMHAADLADELGSKWLVSEGD
ncbi:hypothetical protein [Streptomyces altiplanensis]